MKTKQRTRKSAVKRFKVSATGKLSHRAKGFRHLKSIKTKRWLRRLKKNVVTKGSYKKSILRMLGKK